MTDVFGRRDVSTWELVELETVGRERKMWLVEPGGPTGSRERRWLFKPVVVPANGRRQGEDWVEKLVRLLGALLGVPCADVELAVRHGVEGSISRNVAPDGWNLVLGSVLLTRDDPGYREGRDNVPGRPGHSLAAVLRAPGTCGPAPGVPDCSAAGTFAGYLVLDAWVANRDRHDQNWAVLRRTDGPGETCLAPSFDHASSLGFNLHDDRRTRLLEGDRLLDWTRRGTAHRFEHIPGGPVPSLVGVARAACALVDTTERDRWFEALASTDDASVENAIRRIPGLSGVTITFILELLRLNRRRILDDR